MRRKPERVLEPSRTPPDYQILTWGGSAMDRIHSSVSGIPPLQLPSIKDMKADSETAGTEMIPTESFTATDTARGAIIDTTSASKAVLNDIKDIQQISFSPNCAINTTPIPLLGANNLLFIPGEKGFAALNLQDGEIKWMRETEGYYSYPVSPASSPDGSRIFYVDGNTGTMTAVNSATGERAWKFKCPAGPRLTPPAVSPDGNKVFFGDNNTLFAVDSSSGNKIWEKDLHMNITASATVSPDGKTLYACDSHSSKASKEKKHPYESTLFAIDPETGEKKWRYNLDSQNACSPVAGQDGTVYVGDEGGTIYAINGKTGKIIWKDRKSMEGPWDDFSLVISPDGRTLYGTVEDSLKGGRTFALDIQKTQGKRLSKKPQTLWDNKGAVVHSPALSPDGSTLYVGSDDKKLQALNTKDGTMLWELPAEGRVYNPAVSADGRELYVITGTDDSNPGKDATLITVNTADGKVTRTFQKQAELAGVKNKDGDDLVYCRSRELIEKIMNRQSLNNGSGSPENKQAPSIQKGEEYIIIDGIKLPIKTSSNE